MDEHRGDLVEDVRLLPPGQHVSALKRFGPLQFAGRHITVPERPVLAVGGDVERPAQFELAELLAGAPRRRLHGDLHCVSTWSARDLDWEGVSFREVERLIADTVRPRRGAHWLLVTGLDGYRDCRSLASLRDDGVLLADRLNGAPLTPDHGAPARLVAPAEYGYKSVKHVVSLEYRRRYAAPSTHLLQHPHGRVAREERSRFLPGPVWRRLWALALPVMRWRYRRA